MQGKIESQVPAIPINIGINEKERKQVCQGLSKLLANNYLLYLKTQNYHWNITGGMFRPLHVMFEEQYRVMAERIDTIAERIRSLGEFAPGTFSAFAQYGSIKDDTSVPSAEEMIQNLVQGNETVIGIAREILQLTDEVTDDVTAGMMVEIMQIYEKNAWMLRSMISPNKNSH